MVDFTDKVLRHRLGLPLGFSSKEVVVVDPAMGTGTFLVKVIERVKHTICNEQGDNAVPAQLRSLAKRLIGLEKQIGPFAVAEWRVHSTLRGESALLPNEGARLYVSDTLEHPDENVLPLPTWYEPIARSKIEADRVKRDERVLVVIGNPPYGERAKGLGRWIEVGHPESGVSAPLNAFREPGYGRYEHKLANLYVYFWRWATWKVFDAHADSPSGIVAFISTAGYLSGPGFAGMRRYLRESADEGWIIDLSPEGHRPDVSTRIFRDVQRQLCIGVFCRYGSPHPEKPAQIHYLAVHGSRVQKLERLQAISLEGKEWSPCPPSWQAPFRPGSDALWERHPLLGDILPWSAPGVKPNRTWVYSPDRQVLRSRWQRLISAPKDEKPVLLKENRDRTIHSIVALVPGAEGRITPLALETGLNIEIAPVALRSFDQQWIILDNRVIDYVRPDLWRSHGPRQIYVSELHTSPLMAGPGITLSAHVPDMHCFNGRGGRVLPLFGDAAGTRPNLAPDFLAYLNDRLRLDLDAFDVLAYVAAVVAHGGYTKRFADELKVPGVRVPLTLSPEVWLEAVEVGREVIWLHTLGERCSAPELGRPFGAPSLARSEKPLVCAAIPLTLAEMPESIEYDEATQTLLLGTGRIRPVDPAVWLYQVSGMRVLRKWFAYRKKHPDVKFSSPLNDISPPSWEAEFTDDLLTLIAVLTRLVMLEARQLHLLDSVCSNPLITVDDLERAKVLPPPSLSRRRVRRGRRVVHPAQGTLFSD